MMGKAMTNTTPITTQTQPGQQQDKTPGTRLLDLLAGWSDYVQQDEEGSDEQPPIIDPLLDGYELAGLYQDVAAQIMPLEGEAEDAAVQRIVLERVLPLLLRR